MFGPRIGSIPGAYDGRSATRLPVPPSPAMISEPESQTSSARSPASGRAPTPTDPPTYSVGPTRRFDRQEADVSRVLHQVRPAEPGRRTVLRPMRQRTPAPG